MSILDQIKARQAAAQQSLSHVAIEHSFRDVRGLTAVVDAVAALHFPTPIYALDDHGHLQLDEAENVQEHTFQRNLCLECSDSSVQENLDDGNYDLAGEFGEVGYPCPTITALAPVLGDDE